MGAVSKEFKGPQILKTGSYQICGRCASVFIAGTASLSVSERRNKPGSS